MEHTDPYFVEVKILYPQKLIHRVSNVIIHGKLATTELFLQFGEEVVVRSCQVRWISQVFKQLESTILDGSYGSHWLVNRNIVLMEEHISCQLPTLILLDLLSGCFKKTRILNVFSKAFLWQELKFPITRRKFLIAKYNNGSFVWANYPFLPQKQ